MNTKKIKIFIIIICFVFVLLIALREKDIPLVEEPKPTEEFIEEISEENTLVENDFSEVIPEIELVRNPTLRILITDDTFNGSIHETVKITSGEDFVICGEDGTVYANYGAWEMIDLDKFNLKTGENLIFRSEGTLVLRSLTRAQGMPQYYGGLQVYKEENGYSIVNIVPMEQYLLTVVPSEMPSTYPLEALKTQAICARSYAYYYVLNESGLPYGAHMNDSTDYQVYNNIQETESTNLAVHETEGVLLTKDGMPIPTYFFSTSCGFTTNETIWKEYFNGEEVIEGKLPELAYIAGETKDTANVTFAPIAVAGPEAVEAISIESGVGILYTADALSMEENFKAYIFSDASDFLEAEEQWYRWTYDGTVSSETIEEKLVERYKARPDLILTLNQKENIYVNREIKSVGDIIDMEIIKRLPGGVADELMIVTTKDTYLVIGEYNIRYVLSDAVSDIVRNDGSVVTVSNLLPSAYFIMEPEMSASGVVTGISLTGGGYGHGVGMSQNGAKQAALQGMTYTEILELFYKSLELKEIKTS